MTCCGEGRAVITSLLQLVSRGYSDPELSYLCEALNTHLAECPQCAKHAPASVTAETSVAAIA